MPGLIRLTIAIFILLAAFIPFRAVQAAQSYDNCTGFITSLPTVVASQGVWCLKSNLETAITSGAAITVSANNVTIDCNDFKVGGLQAGLNTLANGIYSDTRLNTTIRHCNVRGFAAGIALNGDGAVVESNRLDLNTRFGMYVNGEASVVRNNLVNDTGGAPSLIAAYAILAIGTTSIQDNVVTNVVGTSGINTETYGLALNGGAGSVVSGNAVRGVSPTGTSQGFGVFAINGAQIFISDNRVSAAGITGKGFHCSPNNGSLKSNIAWGFSDALGNGSCIDDGGNAGH